MNERRRLERTIAFLGISGSGKGTQTAFLLEALPKSVNVSTGGAFRKLARRKNRVGRFIQRTMREGGLMPFWGPIYVWLNAFFKDLDGDENVIFDGAPRLAEEADMLDRFVTDLGRPLPIAIYLKISPAAARRRLLARGRKDDNLRAIAGRFAFFKTNVGKVIAHYHRKGRLVVINGGQPSEEVWREIIRKLGLR